MAFSWQLFKQNGRLIERLSDLEAAAGSRNNSGNNGLPIGEQAPDFALSDLDGRRVTLKDVLASGRGAMLFFTNPGCAQCNPLLPRLGQAQTVEGRTPVAIISTGELHVNRAKAEEHGLAQVLLQQAFEVAEAYRVFGSPGAVLVDEAGLIASERASGVRSVTELLEATPAPRASLLHIAPDGPDVYKEASRS
jgi:methylamine dehydrogenase accessory protein MauD